MKIREILDGEEEEWSDEVECGGEALRDEALRGGASGRGGRGEDSVDEDDEEEDWDEARRAEVLRGGASGHGGRGEKLVDEDDQAEDWAEGLRGGASGHVGGGEASGSGRGGGGGWRDFAQRKLIKVAARVALYPTLAYNVARNKMNPGFHWWDRIDEHVLLGAVPFRSHVSLLKDQGVRGVVTLNEAFETFVPKKVYQDRGIQHLETPTRDYAFAPSLEKICEALEFIHSNALQGDSTYVHCKAGRGRSTTVVLCYLIRYKNMTPEAAWDRIKSKRSHVCLTKSQWEAVAKFNNRNLVGDLPFPSSLASDGDTNMSQSMVVVVDADAEGYNNDAEKDTGSVDAVACYNPNPRKIHPDP